MGFRGELRGRRVGHLVLYALCAAGIVWLMSRAGRSFDHGDAMASVFSGLCALVGLVLQLQDRNAQEKATDVTARTEELAGLVTEQWDNEASLRWVYSSDLLSVAWEKADPELVTEWSTLARTASSWPGSPQVDSGQWADDAEGLARADSQIGEVLTRQVPTRRLVVLGEPGSGKTVLLVRLLRDLLRSRPDGQVPVLFSLASWDPNGRSLRDWLAEQLRRNYPVLRSSGRDWAKTLLGRGCILPLLDGFDELPTDVHSLALRKINEALPAGCPLVLASRAEPFRAAVSHPEATVRLNAAAGIRLKPLTPEHAAEYLRYETGGPDTAASRRWDRVISELGTGSPVSESLSTPLGLFLARTIYNPRPGQGYSAARRHPDELCDTGVYDTRSKVETHLFDAYIPAVYESDSSEPPRWTAERAHTTLTFLARHLEVDREGSPDVAWWELHYAIPLAVRRAVPALVFGVGLAIFLGLLGGNDGQWGIGLLVGLFLALVEVLPRRLRPKPLDIPQRWSTCTFVHRLGGGLVYGLTYGITGAFVGLLANVFAADVVAGFSDVAWPGAAPTLARGPAAGFALGSLWALLVVVPRKMRPAADTGRRWSTPKCRLGAGYGVAYGLLTALQFRVVGVVVAIAVRPVGVAVVLREAAQEGIYAVPSLTVLEGIIFAIAFGLNRQTYSRQPHAGLRLSFRTFLVGFGISWAAVFGLSLAAVGWFGVLQPDDAMAAGVLAVPVALVSGLLVWYTAGVKPKKADLNIAAGLGTLPRDRGTFLLVEVIGGLIFATACALTSGLIALISDADGLDAGFAAWAAHYHLLLWTVWGFVVGMLACFKRGSWGIFVIARSYLTLRRKVPRAYLAFLRDAHEKRGVLRQVGAVYQFRHIELQRHLAQAPSPRLPPQRGPSSVPGNLGATASAGQ